LLCIKILHTLQLKSSNKLMVNAYVQINKKILDTLQQKAFEWFVLRLVAWELLPASRKPVPEVPTFPGGLEFVGNIPNLSETYPKLRELFGNLAQ